MNKRIYIYRNLARLNDLNSADAERSFFECSGSHQWSRRMGELRPFPMLESLFAAVRAEWHALDSEEQVASFGRASGNSQEDAIYDSFSAPSIEKERVHDGTDIEKEIRKMALTNAITLYREKFGFIFVIGSHNLSDREMLAICRERLLNLPDIEIKIAAEEKLKIIEKRVGQLLEK